MKSNIFALGLSHIPAVIFILCIVTTGNTAQADALVSSGGFEIDPTSVSTNIIEESTTTITLTLSRTTDGSPGVCDGSYTITQPTPEFQKLGEYNYQSGWDIESGRIDLTMAGYSTVTEFYTLGDDQYLLSGQTGQTIYTGDNEAEFSDMAEILTNGVNNLLSFGYTIYSSTGFWEASGATADAESSVLDMNPDLAGYTIQEIHRDVNELELSDSMFSFDVDWSIWGYPPAAEWITWTPDSDSLEVGANQSILVTLDAAGLEPGQYQTALEFDPGTECGVIISIPVTLTVDEIDLYPYKVMLPLIEKQSP